MNILGLVWRNCRWGSAPEQCGLCDFLGTGTQSWDPLLIPGGPPLLLYGDKSEGSQGVRRYLKALLQGSLPK